MAAKLTPKQEAFAYAVGHENKNYTQAYRECYNVGENTLARTVWTKASEVANNGKVSARIDEIKKERYKEMQRSFSWTLEEEVDVLRELVKKNRNDLLRAEKNGEVAKVATIQGILGATQHLKEIRREIYPAEEKNDDSGKQPIIQIIKREGKKYEPDSL